MSTAYSHNQSVTVGLGISPSLLVLLMKESKEAPAGYTHIGAITAGGELRPALRTPIKVSRTQSIKKSRSQDYALELFTK